MRYVLFLNFLLYFTNCFSNSKILNDSNITNTHYSRILIGAGINFIDYIQTDRVGKVEKFNSVYLPIIDFKYSRILPNKLVITPSLSFLQTGYNIIDEEHIYNDKYNQYKFYISGKSKTSYLSTGFAIGYLKNLGSRFEIIPQLGFNKNFFLKNINEPSILYDRVRFKDHFSFLLQLNYRLNNKLYIATFANYSAPSNTYKYILTNKLTNNDFLFGYFISSGIGITYSFK